MSLDTIKKGYGEQLKLFRSGVATATLNFNIAADSYYSIRDIPIVGLDQSKLEVLIFGHYTFPLGAPPYTQDYLIQPNVGSVASIITTPGGSPSRAVDAGYKLTRDNLAICVVNSFPHTTMIPVAPFATASISYFIFTY